MNIGNVEIEGIARLAPMAAVSNAPFRLIARECGSGLTTTEEIDAISLVRGSPVAHDIVRHYPGERPLAMQLLGCDVGLLVQAAEMVQEAGADIVDLNMGCPMPKITKQGKGAALMRDVCATAAVLRELRRAISVPFMEPARMPAGADPLAPLVRPVDSGAVVAAIIDTFADRSATWAAAAQMRLTAAAIDPAWLPTLIRGLHHAPFHATTERTRVELLGVAQLRSEIIVSMAPPNSADAVPLPRG